MAIDIDRLQHWAFPEIVRCYNETDTILYALGLGLGQDPTDLMQLQFVFERNLKALPTMGVVLGFPGPWLSDPETGVDYTKVVHGEQHLEIIQSLPVAGQVRCHNHVIAVNDRGAGRGAAVTVGRDLYATTDGSLIARQTSILIARGDGGFVGEPVVKIASRLSPPPERDADVRCEWRVPPQLALIYRLSGDRNPLHADPALAQSAGFERPILHGLASFGIAGYAAISALYRGDPDMLREIGVRFSAPVMPGDTLCFEFWHGVHGDAAFRATAIERNKIVLDHGRVRCAVGVKNNV